MINLADAFLEVALGVAVSIADDDECPTCGAPVTLADPGPPTPDTCPDCGAPQRATRAPDLGAGPEDEDIAW